MIKKLIAMFTGQKTPELSQSKTLVKAKDLHELDVGDSIAINTELLEAAQSFSANIDTTSISAFTVIEAVSKFSTDHETNHIRYYGGDCFLQLDFHGAVSAENITNIWIFTYVDSVTFNAQSDLEKTYTEIRHDEYTFNASIFNQFSLTEFSEVVRNEKDRYSVNNQLALFERNLQNDEIEYLYLCVEEHEKVSLSTAIGYTLTRNQIAYIGK